jgi:hypothetical protein
MPREYRTGSGPAAPSPSGFGSADINLQTPRFVAQTNVAQPENPFAVLQKVLGIGADIGSQMLKMQTAELEGKINLDRAIELKKERAEREADRAEAKQKREEDEAAKAKMADYSLRIAKATTVEEQQAIQKEALGSVTSESAAMDKSVAAQAAQASQSEQRQIESATRLVKTEEKEKIFDSVRAIKASADGSINTAYENNNTEELTTLRNSFTQEAENAPNTETRQMYENLRDETTKRLELLTNREEAENQKSENAAATLAAASVKQTLSPYLDELMADTEYLANSLTGVSDNAIRRALFERARDRLVEKNPDVAAAILLGSQKEQDAVTAQIDAMITPAVDTVTRARNAENYRRSYETNLLSLAERTKQEDVDTLFDEIDSSVKWTSDQKVRAFKEVTDAYIDNGSDLTEKMNRAWRLTQTDNSAVASRAGKQLNQMIIGKTNELALERSRIIQKTPATGDVAATGWNTVHNTLEEFQDHVLSTFGTNRQGFESSPALQQILGPTLVSMTNQYTQDSEKFAVQQRRDESDARRMSPTGRKTMSTESGWKISPLGVALEDGSYVNLKEQELIPMLIDSLTGYSDVAVPSTLAKAVLDGVDNPKNYPLIKAFWTVMNSAKDPTVRNQLISNPKYKDSFAIGAALRYMDRNKEMSPDETIGMITSFTANRKAWSAPNMGSEEGKKRLKDINEAITRLSSDAAFDSGWWFTDSGQVSSSEAFDSRSPAEQATLLEYAALAACYPNASDQATLMHDMMKQDGYGFYRYTREGTPIIRMYRNVPGYNGNLPLPDPEAMETSEWGRYMDHLKPAAAKALSTMPQLDNTGMPRIYKLEEIQVVEIDPYDQDLLEGHSAIRVKVADRWIHIPTMKFKINAQNFYEYANKVLPEEKRKVREEMEAIERRNADFGIRPKF